MSRGRIRKLADLARRTPLHPQWLLGHCFDVGNRLHELARGRVMDIGCSDGWAKGCLPPGCEYIGLDYYATGRLMYGSKPDLFADAAELPVQDACVDVVLLLEVIEHLRRPRQALAEAARVLRPGGRLILSIPFLYPIHDAPHDYQRYTIHGLVRELESAGLRVDEVVRGPGSARTAGLVACLCIGGMLVESARSRHLSLLLAPLMLLALPIINLAAWVVEKLMPDWQAATAGYSAVATKP